MRLKIEGKKFVHIMDNFSFDTSLTIEGRDSASGRVRVALFLAQSSMLIRLSLIPVGIGELGCTRSE